jgi:4-diphosphocytidyl-2-C-methyl-D-erythritol kinase
LKSPAKVNLYLEIVSRRADGYHELVTMMRPVALYDDLVLEMRSKGIALSCDSPGVPSGQANIAVKAAKLFFDETGVEGGVAMRLEKNIPAGAGLGGGSGNAAAVLVGLDELCGTRLSHSRLHAMAEKLGSDVPLFLKGGACIARGRGEKLRRVKLPEQWFVLVNPGFAVPTKWAYAAWDGKLTKVKSGHNIKSTGRRTIAPGRNDLELVVAKRWPVILRIKAMLAETGANPAMMSGSGSTVFGVFNSVSKARAAMKRIRPEKGWKIYLARGL